MIPTPPDAELADPAELAYRKFYGQSAADITGTEVPPTRVVAQAARRAGVEMVNPVGHICSAGRCTALSADGRLLYRGASHLRSSTTRRDIYGLLEPYSFDAAPVEAGVANAP